MLWKLNFIPTQVLNTIIEFEWKIKNKWDLWKQYLNDRERHVALKMPTSEAAHTGRERSHLQNNIKGKPEQLKLNKTNPSMWP
jgi:hypothetical protein